MVYDHLYVHDDAERELPARLDLAGDTLSIVVDDAGASYPITIDPLASSPGWVVENTGEFGTNVSTAGDVNGDGFDDILIGAHRFDGGEFHEGKVFLYMGGPDGPESDPDWTFESNEVRAGLGAVAGAGDVNGDGYSDLLIGAPMLDTGGVDDTGRAYLYHGSEDGLAGLTAKWSYAGDTFNGDMGRAVATAGDVNGDGYADIIVGAPDAGDGALEVWGRAFVFHGSASGVRANPAWMGRGTQDRAYYGGAVSTAGDTDGDGDSEIIVGAQWHRPWGNRALRKSPSIVRSERKRPIRAAQFRRSDRSRCRLARRHGSE